MKSLILAVSLVLISASSFAQNTSADAIFNGMEKAEAQAERVNGVKNGEYFFGDKQARMLIYSDATILHAVQVRADGKIKSFAIRSEDDKRSLKQMADAGAVINALSTYLVQNVEIDGVVFELLAVFPGRPDKATLTWQGSKHTESVIGLPGLRKKDNRYVTIYTNAKTGQVTGGEIFQVSLSTLLKAQTLPLIVP